MEQFSAKTATLIECLLPQLIEDDNENAEIESSKSEGAVSDLSRIIQLDQQILGTERLDQPVHQTKKTKKKRKISDSPLHFYIIHKKHTIIKLAINKLANTLKQCENKVSYEAIGTPRPLQELFVSLMESVGPFLNPKSANATPNKESLLLNKQNSSLELLKQSSIASSSNLQILERSKSLVQPALGH